MIGKTVPCNLCGSIKGKFLFNAKDRLHGCEGTFTYVKCKMCGLVYMNPQILPEDAGKFYPNDYGPHKATKNRQQNRLTMKTQLKKRSFGTFICNKLTSQSRLLDVGCGNGKFLYEIKSSVGCNVYGVDISEKAAKIANRDYGLDVFTGTIMEVPFPSDYFNMITAWQYLEHVHNPLEVLQKFYHLLKADGVCIISTPNFNSFNSKVFKDRWYALDCPRHLHIYTPKTIDKFLEKAGFLLTGISYDKSSKNLLGSLQYHFYGDNYTAEYRNRIKRSLIVKAVLSPLTRVFALLKKSDNIIVSARKVTRNEFADNK